MMKRLPLVFVALCLALLVSACGVDQRSSDGKADQGGQQMFDNPRDAAADALATLKQLVAKTPFEGLGFKSADEAAKAELGEPLSVYFVKLDQLRAYQPKTDPNTLLTQLPRFRYPVLLGESVKASIVIEKGDKGWHAASFGESSLSQAIAEAGSKSAMARAPTRNVPATAASEGAAMSSAGTAAQPASERFLVRISALNLYFLGYRADGRLLLIPVGRMPTPELQTGEPIPAAKVFEVLVPIARTYNGLPQ